MTTSMNKVYHMVQKVIPKRPPVTRFHVNLSIPAPTWLNFHDSLPDGISGPSRLPGARGSACVARRWLKTRRTAGALCAGRTDPKDWIHH